MRRAQHGFTMIELIVVIVILGVLAATALPRFIDLRSDAMQSASDGMAAQLASAMTINYAGCSASHHVVAAGKCVAVSNCSQGLQLLMGGAFPANTGGVTYAITAGAIGSGGAGDNGNTATCNLVATKGSLSVTSPFSGVSAGL